MRLNNESILFLPNRILSYDFSIGSYCTDRTTLFLDEICPQIWNHFEWSIDDLISINYQQMETYYGNTLENIQFVWFFTIFLSRLKIRHFQFEYFLKTHFEYQKINFNLYACSHKFNNYYEMKTIVIRNIFHNTNFEFLHKCYSE